MQRAPLESSVILAAGYEAGTHTLEVEFRNHRIYRYLDVPAEDYQALRAAESPGAYFSAHIRNIYECWRLVNAAHAKHHPPAPGN